MKLALFLVVVAISLHGMDKQSNFSSNIARVSSLSLSQNSISFPSLSTDDIHKAVRKGDHQTVSRLIEHNYNLESIDKKGCTPLLWACYLGKYTIAQLLLNNRANPCNQANIGITPLYASLLFSFKDLDFKHIVSLLLDYGADINQHNEFLKIIPPSDRGDKPIETIYFHTPLGLAVGKKDVGLVHYLIQKGAQVNQSAKDFVTHQDYIPSPFRDNHAEIIQLLLSSGLDLNFTLNGLSIMRHAIESGDQSLVEKLVSGGANLQEISKNSVLLHPALKQKKEFIVTFLLGKGVPAQQIDCFGNSTWHILAEINDPKIAMQALKHTTLDADQEQLLPFDSVNKTRHETPLHVAANLGNMTMLQLLVYLGAQRNKRNKEHKTPFDLVDPHHSSAEAMQALLANPERYFKMHPDQFTWIDQQAGHAAQLVNHLHSCAFAKQEHEQEHCVLQ